MGKNSVTLAIFWVCSTANTSVDIDSKKALTKDDDVLMGRIDKGNGITSILILMSARLPSTEHLENDRTLPVICQLAMAGNVPHVYLIK
ncbi:hypothetical protein BDZ97DRAFT_1785396 [Flammula alnicola]|nr:hypothetical protein BDZ97DRAFT_1785396 [Flammula alnicola]